MSATMNLAAEYFAARLWSPHGAAAREALASLGVDEGTARLLRLGVAADDANDLARRLAPNGVSRADLVKAGLVDGSGDRLRGQIVVPLLDRQGHVSGFLPFLVAFQERQCWYDSDTGWGLA